MKEESEENSNFTSKRIREKLDNLHNMQFI